jgi:UDP-N-acetylglucosamine diphosphorylase/glucosamine-1-phosphate N-acetyltransferase
LTRHARLVSATKSKTIKTMKIHLFEDEGVERLSPITTSRPAYGIRCGGLRLLDVAAEAASSISASVRDYLVDVQSHEFAEIDGVSADSSDWLLNARLVPRCDLIQKLESAHAGKKSPVAWLVGHQLAAVQMGGQVAAPKSLEASDVAAWIAANRIEQRPAPQEVALFDFPHDVIRFHELIFAANLSARIQRGDLKEIASGVFAAEGVDVPDVWSVDTSEGPIVLERGCRVGPFTLLLGPVLVGAGAKVNEYAALKHNVALGHTTKVGGEVEATIIEPFTNKQHHGFLGHSYVGSWVNFGAGTCNSDLKNTYGTVRIDYGGERVDSGMQFVGCVCGDYVKTAIQTAIFTGKLIGVCSMLYGFVTRNVPAFVNFAPNLGQVTQVDPEVIVTMQERMFKRRGQQQQPYHLELIRQMYARTSAAREGIEVRPPAF